MRTGDLCKLIARPHPHRLVQNAVEVGLDADRSLFLPSGALVIYVGRKQYDDGSSTGEPEYWDAIDVLVGEVIGWVYFHELGLADEAR